MDTTLFRDLDPYSCGFCGKPISTERRRRHAKFCTSECRTARDRATWRKLNPRLHDLPRWQVGAANELRAAYFLMTRSFDVFRNMSHVGVVDLAAHSEKTGWLGVQVRTGSMMPSGKLTFPKQESSPGFDVLIVVCGDEISVFDSEENPLKGHPWKT